MPPRAPEFLKDHELRRTVDERGKARRRYVYTGDRYERRLTPAQRRAERYAGVLAALVAGGLTVFATMQDTPANRGGFFGVLSVLTLIPAIGVLAGALMALFRKGDLTAREYHERLVLLRAMALIAAGLLVLLTVGYAINGAWLAFAAALAAAALYAVVGIHELKVGYIVHPAQPPAEE